MNDEDITRLRIALARIARFTDRQASREGITRSQMSVLGTTARLGPLGLGELAEIEGVNPTMLSRIIGKLEAAGLLRRLPDPADHRAIRVEATAKGRSLQDRLRRERTQLLIERVGALPSARSAELLAALPALELLAESMGGRPSRARESASARP